MGKLACFGMFGVAAFPLCVLSALLSGYVILFLLVDASKNVVPSWVFDLAPG